VTYSYNDSRTIQHSVKWKMTFRPKNQTRICVNLLLLGSILRRKVATLFWRPGSKKVALRAVDLAN
jgi:hypothetical protein